MSGGVSEEPVKSAVPVADLSILDGALSGGEEALRETLKKLRPADVGRDLSRRDPRVVKRIVEASDDRRAGAMMRIAHPATAATVLASCDAARSAKVLAFLSTDHQVSILGHMSKADRTQLEAAMDPASRETVEKHLKFPEASVARSMTPKVWRAVETATVREALEGLKRGGAH
jgi:Mg/Co/Ni transporter MgtE